MNSVCLIGRITANPEMRVLSSGVEVCGFTLAVNRNFVNADGEREADFINCVAFRNSAKIIADYVSKGNLLGIEGRIQTRNYDDKDGKKVYVTEVIVNQVDLLTPKQEKSEGSKEQSKEQSKTESNPFEDFGKSIEISEDELPF